MHGVEIKNRAHRDLEVQPNQGKRPLSDPKMELSSLLQRGRTILQDVETIRLEAQNLDPALRAGNAVLSLFQVEGRRGLAAFGRYFASGGLSNRRSALSSSFEQWCSEVLVFLRRISTHENNSPPKENSPTLTRRFTKTRAYSRLDTQITKAVRFLEVILEEKLVYNEEIPVLRRTWEDSRILDLSAVQLPSETFVLADRRQLLNTLSAHPKVGQMLEGALDAYSLGGKDANRQALSSCRSALELLIIEITGEREWRRGLEELTEGRRKKIVSEAYGFLSGYGSHPGTMTTRKDAVFGIRLTLAACLWLVEKTNSHGEISRAVIT